jgi:hypothetical protein
MRKGLRFARQALLGIRVGHGPRHYLLVPRRRLSKPTMPNPSAREIQVVGSGAAGDSALLIDNPSSSGAGPWPALMRKGLHFAGKGRYWESAQVMSPRRRLTRPTMPNPSASETQVVGSGVADSADTLLIAKRSWAEPLSM